MDYRTPNIYDPSTLTEPYAYARANPVMFWDPDGLKEISYQIGNTNYILDIDDETWAAILHGELTFAGITLFDPLAPVTPQWVMHHSVGEDFPDMKMTNREEVWHYQKELMSREAKQLAFIQAFMPRHTNTVFPWILKDVLKSLNDSDARGRGAIYRALYQAGMLHQVNVANGFGRDFAQEAALALVGPQITHYKRFGFWQDLEVAGWVVTAGDAGWILKGLIRPSKSLLTHSFDDLLPVASGRGTIVPYDAKFAAKQMGLDPERFAQLPRLRQEYVTNVVSLRYQVPGMRQAGMSSEQIARYLHAQRRALGARYKKLTPTNELERILARNLERYGDELGPSVEWLRQRNKSWEDIIESATRPGGEDLGY